MKKTVKDAVDYFKGVWPTVSNYLLHEQVSCEDYWLPSNNSKPEEQAHLVCTREEFEQEVERQSVTLALEDEKEVKNAG